MSCGGEGVNLFVLLTRTNIIAQTKTIAAMTVSMRLTALLVYLTYSLLIGWIAS